MIEIREEFLADVLGTSQEKIAEALKDGETLKPQADIEQSIKDLLDDHIFELKKSVHKTQYAKGKKEALTRKERELKEKFELEGNDLEDMISNLIEKTKVKPDMTPEDVRNTEIFKHEQQRWQEAVKAAEARAQEAEQSYSQRLTRLKMRDASNQLLQKHQFVTPEGVADESAWFDLLMSRLENGKAKVQVGDDGNLIVVDENGSQLQDDRLNNVTYEDYFVDVASKLFKVAQSDGRKSPGNRNDVKPDGKNSSPGQAPESEQDFLDNVARIQGVEEKRQYIADHGSKFGVQL